MSMDRGEAPLCVCGCGNRVTIGAWPYPNRGIYRWNKVLWGHWEPVLAENTLNQAGFARKYGISRTMAHTLFRRYPPTPGRPPKQNS